MSFSWYSILLDAAKWMLVGFAVGFFIRDVQKKFNRKKIHIKAATVLAITLSIVLLFLLVGGYDVTILAILATGTGIVLHLLAVAFYRGVSNISLVTRVKNKPLNSSSAMSHTSLVSHR